ncbi:MAG: beta-propeller fold lactonase family protein [Chitinophagaceae bacterium]|nr:beta-propeller fold lactonase family protein [Chitinophagaceae bacterium]
MNTKIKFAAIVVTTLFLASCQKNIQTENNTEPALEKAAEEIQFSERGNGNNNRGFVYTLSNQASGNKVLVYKRSSTGMLTYETSVSTGGNGSGGGLGNQGAVIITDDGDVLLAVNPGSNTISSFKITGNGLNLKSTVSSGGTRPVSIAQHDGLVYVLNAGGSGNISGFRLGNNDKLTPISYSTKPLSSSSAGAAQVSFVRNGKVLVITEKATNKIITYRVNNNGLPLTMRSITSASPTPFGFAPGRFGNIYVSEAVGGATNASNVSSYQIGFDGSISLTDGPVATGQSAACWVVLTDNGQHIYTTNTASNTLSSYNVQQYAGNISLKHSIAGTTQMGPIDAALTDNSKYLYILNSGSNSISSFAVSNNGNLSSLETVTGLPVGSNGLAAN